MFDIDHFKKFNDTYGHDVGDLVLKRVARIVKNTLREVDLLARYGGEEFIILLPDTDQDSAVMTAERIREAVKASQYKLPNGESITVTASIGISSTCPERSGNDLKTLSDSLIARADVALYQAKAAGRDQVAVDGNG